MKFEMVEPSDESATIVGDPHPVPADEGSVGPKPFVFGEPGDTSVMPVKDRMAKTVDGVRASLNLLKAHVAEQSMAEAHRLAASAPEADAGTAFHAYRFTASPGKGVR
ncbi:cell envelope biogenesis protein TolA [Nocardiopsis alba]|uniref:Cell envelope biogenesis protein TolA n=1 Tax=Nocardiopsis alba TaxID=53437 RepID=A0ABV5DQE2_9ACTN